MIFLFGPLRFFLFGTQFPGCTSLRRRGSYLEWFRRVRVDPSHRRPWRATLLDAFVATCVAQVGCYLHGDTFLAASIDAYTLGGGLHRTFSSSLFPSVLCTQFGVTLVVMPSLSRIVNADNIDTLLHWQYLVSQKLFISCFVDILLVPMAVGVVIYVHCMYVRYYVYICICVYLVHI